MGAEEDIAEALQPTVSAAGLEIWDVERAGASLRVLVERPGGVDLDSIAAVSAAVSAVLDERDDLSPAGRYTLEVSSPGLERRLRYPRHFTQYVGQEVSVKTAEAVNGSRRLQGTLIGATEDDITIRVTISKTESAELRLPLTAVERATTVFTWGDSSKTARSPRPRKAAAPAWAGHPVGAASLSAEGSPSLEGTAAEPPEEGR
jgi:ribosome maturation factor RimP